MLSMHAKSSCRMSKVRAKDRGTTARRQSTSRVEVRGLHIAMLIGSEMWAPRGYEEEHLDVLAIPRAGDMAALGDCVERACSLAQHAHAFAASSNTFRERLAARRGSFRRKVSCSDRRAPARPFLSVNVALHATHGESRHFDVFAH